MSAVLAGRVLVDAATLHGLLGRPDVLVVDCRFELSDPGSGPNAYAQGHVPGSVYANLDHDLSDLTRAGLGRHPMPDAADFSRVLSRWGWAASTAVVAYDAAGGALAAARLWWMLRLVGAREAAVLDGGFSAWQRAGLPLSTDAPPRRAADIDVRFDARQIVGTDEVETGRLSMLLLDARGAPRFRGEVEPIDKVAGHIPGAVNRPFSDNLAADGTFKPAAALRGEFSALLASRSPGEVVHMCGSGVTACHSVLAMEHAGLHGSRVYAPSWSGWISDPKRAVATGA